MGNVQVLLQKLLCAEQIVQERNWCFNKEQRGQTLAPRRARERPPSQSSNPLTTKPGPETQSDPTRRSDVMREVGNVEMGQKKVKCFKCHQRGHIALNCPQTKEPNARCVTTDNKAQPVDPLVLSVIAEDDSGSSTSRLYLVWGPSGGCPHMSFNRFWSLGNFSPRPDATQDKGEVWLDTQGMSFPQQATRAAANWSWW